MKCGIRAIHRSGTQDIEYSVTHFIQENTFQSAPHLAPTSPYSPSYSFWCSTLRRTPLSRPICRRVNRKLYGYGSVTGVIRRSGWCALGAPVGFASSDGDMRIITVGVPHLSASEVGYGSLECTSRTSRRSLTRITTLLPASK